MPPAILSVAEEAFTPRRTTLMDALKARQKPVNLLTLDELGLGGGALEGKRRLISSSDEGLVMDRRHHVLRGAPAEELADSLIDALVELDALQEASR